jgi:ABC-type multidrug transport system ATPase subunit
VGEEICNRVGIIKYGKLIYDVSINELKQMQKEHNHNIEELFIALTQT